MNSRIDKMREINVAQKEYYEKASGGEESSFNNDATNFYRRIRKKAFSVLQPEEVMKEINLLHLNWMGDISKSKVLDLGLGEGNPHSFLLAKNAQSYIGIDLSQTRINRFRERLNEKDIRGAKTLAVDFLSSEFEEKDFDVVYALAVLHHFEHIESFLKILHSKLSSNGVVISYDPLETWLPAKLLRMIYRPFQKDAKWEFPFKVKTFKQIQKYFIIEEIQGVYGRSKWAIPLSLLNSSYAKRKALKWHKDDFKYAISLSKAKSCLQVSMKLRKRELKN